MEKKEISLMQGYAVQIQGMVEDGTSGYLHLVEVPKDALSKGKDLTVCKLLFRRTDKYCNILGIGRIQQQLYNSCR